MRFAGSLVASCLLFSFVGCGTADRGLEKAPVSGVVTYKGEPVGKGSVVFQHTSGEVVAGALDAEGKYKAEVPVGENQVLVQSRDDETFDEVGVPSGHKGMTMPGKTRIPEHYSAFDSSKLKFDVKQGDNTYDIPLEGEIREMPPAK